MLLGYPFVVSSSLTGRRVWVGAVFGLICFAGASGSDSVSSSSSSCTRYIQSRFLVSRIAQTKSTECRHHDIMVRTYPTVFQ
eukprot:gene14401-biopygen16818